MNPAELAVRPEVSVVPGAYAEKAMATLMQLHGELMEEKERRVDMYRRLMEKEQALAEMKMYVKLLEEKLASKKLVRRVPVPPAKPLARKLRQQKPVPPQPAPVRATGHGTVTPISSARPQPQSQPPPRKIADAWKTW